MSDAIVDNRLRPADLETLFPAVAETLDQSSTDRRLLVMTKAFIALAYRCGDVDQALTCLQDASRDPRSG